MDGSGPARAWIACDAMQALLRAQSEATSEEPCGVLLGRVEQQSVRIRETPGTRNTHPSPERAFRIAPQDILRVARAGRERGLTVLGFWHGHLSGPADAGEADADGLAAAEALGPSARVLVIMGRGAGRAPVVRAFVRGPRGRARSRSRPDPRLLRGGALAGAAAVLLLGARLVRAVLAVARAGSVPRLGAVLALALAGPAAPLGLRARAVLPQSPPLQAPCLGQSSHPRFGGASSSPRPRPSNSFSTLSSTPGGI